MAELKARLIGLVIIALGLGIGWFFGWHPLQQAWVGAKNVEYSIKAFLAAPMLVVAGLFLLLGGAPVLRAFSGPPQGRQQHAIVWSVMALALAAGGFGFWWFQAQLDLLGYR